MSNRALSFIGRLDRREESFVMNQLQEQEFRVGCGTATGVNNLYGRKRVRDVYSPPTRNVDGSAPVMSKN